MNASAEPEKQTQTNPTCRGVASGEAGSNPTCSELACPELVEGVEPISKWRKPCLTVGTLAQGMLIYY